MDFRLHLIVGVNSAETGGGASTQDRRPLPGSQDYLRTRAGKPTSPVCVGPVRRWAPAILAQSHGHADGPVNRCLRYFTSCLDVKCGIVAKVEQSHRAVSREIAVEGLEQAAILMVRHLAVRTGLGLTANLTLGTLNREGPARVTALAAAASIGQPAMTELVQRLERQRLVTRVEDPGDGRAAVVTITNAGRALLDDQQRDRRDRMAELLTGLPADDEVTLTLAMHVALPIIRRLIDDAQQSRTLVDSDTPISQSRT